MSKIKQDKNFLFLPAWYVGKTDVNSFEVKNKQGIYTIKCSSGLPQRTDAVFMVIMLKMLERNIGQNCIVTSRYEVLKQANLSRAQKNYNRVMESLDKWKNTEFNFCGCFYDGKEYRVKCFNPINEYELNKSKNTLIIHFNQTFLEIIRNSNFYHYIDTDMYLKLKNNLSLRLYELLEVQFSVSNPYIIKSSTIAEKLTIMEKYPSIIKRKIEAALKDLKKELNYDIALISEKNRHDETIFKFKKAEKKERPKANDCKEKQQKQHSGHEADFSTKTKTKIEQYQIPADVKELLELLPENYRLMKVYQELISKYLDDYGYEIVQSNLDYVRQANKKNEIKNMKKYIEKAMNEDYAAEKRELKKISQEKEKQEFEKKIEEDKINEEKEAAARAEANQYISYINNIDPSKKKIFYRDLYNAINPVHKSIRKTLVLGDSFTLPQYFSHRELIIEMLEKHNLLTL